MSGRTNQPQRLQPDLGGVIVKTAEVRATYVDRPNIEAAAREGYLDALAGLGFSRHYDAAPGPWQRNYEIGRLWACGIRACELEAPEWPAEMKRQPVALSQAVEEVARRIGALRPEIEGMKEADPNLPVLHEPLLLRRGRFW